MFSFTNLNRRMQTIGWNKTKVKRVKEMLWLNILVLNDLDLEKC